MIGAPHLPKNKRGYNRKTKLTPSNIIKRILIIQPLEIPPRRRRRRNPHALTTPIPLELARAQRALLHRPLGHGAAEGRAAGELCDERREDGQAGVDDAEEGLERGEDVEFDLAVLDVEDVDFVDEFQADGGDAADSVGRGLVVTSGKEGNRGQHTPRRDQR